MTTPRREVLAEGVEVWLADCREVLPLIEKIDAVVSDPPYGMSFHSKASKEKGRHDKIVGDETDELLLWACALKPTHSAYLFCRWDNIPRVPTPTSVLTWVKNSWSMGDLEHAHARMTEICLFYPGPKHFWVGKRPADVMTAGTTGNEHHPTEKPVNLMSYVIGFTSGIVLDPFMGSGSTGVAAVNVGRKFIGIEIDKKHFDVARKRIAAALKQPFLFVDKPEPTK